MNDPEGSPKATVAAAQGTNTSPVNVGKNAAPALHDDPAEAEPEAHSQPSDRNEQGKTDEHQAASPVSRTSPAANGFLAVLVSGGDIARLSAASLALVCSPLVLLAVLAIFFSIDVIVSSWGGRLFGFSYDLVFFVGIFGALGAMVSVMLHISNPQKWQNLTPLDIFFRFLFRPFLGFVYAVLALLIVRADIVPDHLDQLQAIRDLNSLSGLTAGADSGQQVAIMLLIAFLAGFSERMVKAILQTVEDRIRALAIGPNNAKTT